MLCTSAAGIVNATIPSIAATTALRRLATGDRLRRVTKSDSQPATNEPTNPHRNGTDAANPVRTRLMCRSIVR